MHFQFTPYVFPLIAAALISSWVAVYAWSRRTNRGAIALTLLAAAVAGWALGYALEIAGADLPTKIIWGKFQYVGIIVVPLLWLGFAFHHANQASWLTARSTSLLAILPIVTLILVMTTERHGLVWNRIEISRTGEFSALQVSYGPWFWIHTAYSYVLLLIGTFIVLRSIGKSSRIYRRQALVLLLAVFAPWIGNALYLSGLSPVPELDLTPFAFTITVVAFTWGIYGFHLVDLAPIGRATVIDEMSAGMIVLDKGNRIVDINPSALRIIGQSESDVVGRNAGDILTAWPELTRKYADIMEAIDEITLGSGEQQRLYELRLSPLHDRRNDIVGRAITISEITARKRAEALLLESEARYRQIVENARDLIYRTDEDGRFTYANSVLLRFMGVSTEAHLVGRTYLQLVAPHAREEVKRFYEIQSESGKRSSYYEFPAVTASGQNVWLGQNVQIIELNGHQAGFQAVARDITDLRRTQDALAAARDQAMEGSRLKSQLLAKVSHELRTPLGGILGYAELLQMHAFGQLSEAQHDAVHQIIDSTYYLTKLVDELLDEAQIEAKSLRLYIDRFSPNDLLRRVESSLATLIEGKGLEFSTTIDESVPQILYGDEQRLHQILVNLVGNAIKFTHEGSIRVRISSPDRDFWSMQVSDTGPGIPEAAREYIFEPFTQVDSPGTVDTGGTGLGLAITKQLVDLMYGEILLDSEVGRGSTFTVLLPIGRG